MILPPLDDADRERYAWQMTAPVSARRASAGSRPPPCSSRGAVASVARSHSTWPWPGSDAWSLPMPATLRLSDLNRQVLMSSDGLGRPRADLMAERLRQVNPTVQVDTIDSNVAEANVDALVAKADIVACAAPLFEERFAMNDACVRAPASPSSHAAMFEFEFQVAVFHLAARCRVPVFRRRLVAAAVPRSWSRARRFGHGVLCRWRTQSAVDSAPSPHLADRMRHHESGSVTETPADSSHLGSDRPIDLVADPRPAYAADR